MANDSCGSEWLLVMLVDAGNVVFEGHRVNVGNFEITKKREPFFEAESAFSQSIASYNYQLSSQHMRMRTLLKDCSFEEARREGRLHASESLNLLKYSHVFVDQMRLLEPGCLVDLHTLQAHAFINISSDWDKSLFGNIAIFDRRASFPLSVINRWMRLDPLQTVELWAAVRRSAHWADLADQAEDLGERFLLRWMAIECLCRVGRDDTISAKVAAAALLPSGRYEISLPSTERSALASVAEFGRWRKRLNLLIDKLRDMRNSIVHSGFREVDLSSLLNAYEIHVATRLLISACVGAQRMALGALELGIVTIEEMWSRYSECVLRNRQCLLAEDVTKLLHTLENPGPK